MSRWEASEVGPDRCLYSVTPLGRDWLQAWADTLAETKRTLGVYLYRYAAISAAEAGDPAPPPLPPHPGRRITLDDAPAFRSLVQSTESQTSAEDLTW